jgi:hypothetical protein
MEIALQIDHPGIPSKLRKRYAEMLTARAVRFYIEGNLDSVVVSEDLYHGEDFSCDCSQSNADRNRHNASCEYAGGKNFVNIADSEKTETEFQRKLSDLLKTLK